MDSIQDNTLILSWVLLIFVAILVLWGAVKWLWTGEPPTLRGILSDVGRGILAALKVIAVIIAVVTGIYILHGLLKKEKY